MGVVTDAGICGSLVSSVWCSRAAEQKCSRGGGREDPQNSGLNEVEWPKWLSRRVAAFTSRVPSREPQVLLPTTVRARLMR